MKRVKKMMANQHLSNWTLDHAILQNAAKNPDKIAIIFENENITYAELEKKVKKNCDLDAKISQKRGQICLFKYEPSQLFCTFISSYTNWCDHGGLKLALIKKRTGLSNL